MKKRTPPNSQESAAHFKHWWFFLFFFRRKWNKLKKSWILIKIEITENFFPNFKIKVCSQDFSTNKLEVDFLCDLPVVSPGVNKIRIVKIIKISKFYSKIKNEKQTANTGKSHFRNSHALWQNIDEDLSNESWIFRLRAKVTFLIGQLSSIDRLGVKKL